MADILQYRGTPSGSNSTGVTEVSATNPLPVSIGGSSSAAPVGGTYNTTKPTYTNGQSTVLQTNVNGALDTNDVLAPQAEDNTNNVIWTHQRAIGTNTNTLSADQSSALEASSVTKASAGRLYEVDFTNTNAATRYLQFFNSTTVPVDGTAPILSFAVPAGQTFQRSWPRGIYFATGISWCNSSTPGTKTVGAADSYAYVQYV